MTFSDAEVTIHLGQSAPLIVGTGSDDPAMTELQAVTIKAPTVKVKNSDILSQAMHKSG
jgi:hypothetical protein